MCYRGRANDAVMSTSPFAFLLDGYDYIFIYILGKGNFITDMLSHYPIGTLFSTNVEINFDDTNDGEATCLIDYNTIVQHQTK